jgi:hypothetical protein
MQELRQIFRVELLRNLSFVSIICFLLPPPPGGYFGRKIFIFSHLQTVCVGKIFITKGLRLKYLFSTNWPRMACCHAGLVHFFLTLY